MVTSITSEMCCIGKDRGLSLFTSYNSVQFDVLKQAFITFVF